MQPDKHTDKHTERHTDSQTDRNTDTNRQLYYCHVLVDSSTWKGKAICCRKPCHRKWKTGHRLHEKTWKKNNGITYYIGITLSFIAIIPITWLQEISWSPQYHSDNLTNIIDPHPSLKVLYERAEQSLEPTGRASHGYEVLLISAFLASTYEDK